jgi:hypothetical protein
MPLIEFVCTASHEGDTMAAQEGPSITLYRGKWALCARGGSDGHAWAAIEPTDAEMLKAGHGGLRDARLAVS